MTRNLKLIRQIFPLALPSSSVSDVEGFKAGACGWLVVLGFNTALTSKVISWRSVMHMFPGFLTPILNKFSFQSHRLLFSHASAEVRGENTLERKVASTRNRTHNHQVMSPTRSPLSHPGGAWSMWIEFKTDPATLASCSVEDLRTGGRRFESLAWAISFPRIMIVIATGFIPLLPLSIFLTMVM